jgi:hypothetical protein
MQREGSKDRVSREVIFAGDDILAYTRSGTSAGPLVITFGAIPPTRNPGIGGFGDEFLFKRQIDAIHVVPLRKHWYQTVEMAALLPVLRARREAAGRCVLYGSSMGGYASLLYAGRLDADAVIAFSPQISIDPRKARFDKRWLAVGKTLTFIDDDAVGHSRAASNVTLFFDPFDRRDHRHVQGFAGPQVRAYPIPFAGHQVAGMLAQTGCLADLVTDLIHDRFAWAPIRNRMRAGRRATPTYWRGMFYSAMDRPRYARLARIALDGLVETGDVRPQLLCATARAAIRRRRFDVGLLAAQHAVRHGADARLIAPLAKELSGRVAETDIAGLVAAFPDEIGKTRRRAPRILSRVREIVGF